ncbi:hypothetical protein T09_14096 [Trichinella sp. T9]|nr:hypothetical protein T09_14096 [Trichinella sp. T9]
MTLRTTGENASDFVYCRNDVSQRAMQTFSKVLCN